LKSLEFKRLGLGYQVVEAGKCSSVWGMQHARAEFDRRHPELTSPNFSNFKPSLAISLRADAGNRLHPSSQRELHVGLMFQAGQLVRVNLAGSQAEGVMFQVAVTDAVGHIVRQTSEQPPKYLVKLLFSFRGVSEVEVPADRIHAQS
jgi:hypothetical protein